MTASEKLDAVLARADAGFETSLDRLYALLRIPSVSTEAAHREDCAACAEHLRGMLAGLGFAAELAQVEGVSPGHPIVLAETPAGPNGHRALFYGHYDVQPVDPLELWSHPPFQPQREMRDGVEVIAARGAADDKGQVMTFIEACRAWIEETGSVPIPLRFMIEGEEEAGGASLEPFLAKRPERARAKVGLVCDTNMWALGRPAIVTSLRGMVTGQVTIKAANRDLHSGYYGSAARNPIALLAKILAELRAEDGSVTLPGFYDAAPEPSEALRASWETLGFDGAAFLGEVGLSVPAGEADRSVLEQTKTRPTAEINGIWGGYTGDGFKTVIPAEAHAKISFRLVGDMDPNAVWESFEAHVRARLPEDCAAVFSRSDGARGVSVSAEQPDILRASAALAEEWGGAPALVGAGGSIPVVEQFKRLLDMEAVLVGFGRANDNIHSPNEKYDVESYRKGIRSWVRILAKLSEE